MEALTLSRGNCTYYAQARDFAALSESVLCDRWGASRYCQRVCVKDDSCWLWLLLLLPLLLYLLFLLLYKWLKNLCCPPPVPIYVEDVNGKVYTVMANMTDTILSIKQKVALETGLPVHEHFLSFEEQAELKDRKALKYNGIKVDLSK